MQLLNVDELIPHMKNGYFFDDIEGEPWMAFLESVKTSGVIEPVIATQDKVIVSGHQRVRACKKLGIKQVWTDIRTFDSEDEVLKQLIETNIRQRGVGNTNAVKLGRCIAELERIYGVRNGGDRRSENFSSNIVGSEKSQEDLLTELGMNKESYRQYKKLVELPEDIQQMVLDGVVTPSTASRIIAKLSPEEQGQLADQIRGKENVSGSEVQEHIAEIKSENERLRKLVSEKDAQRIVLEQRLAERPTVAKVEVKEVEVVPADYEDLKKKAKLAKAYETDYKREQQKVADEKNRNLELQNEIDELRTQTAQATSSAKLIEGSIYFVAQCGSFVRDMGGYVWIADKIAELPERERNDFIRAIGAIRDWSDVLMQNIERNR